MPDRFIPYPSPPLSTCSPPHVADTGPAVHQPTWAIEPTLDAMYMDPHFLCPEIPELTEEQLASLELELICDPSQISPPSQRPLSLYTPTSSGTPSMSPSQLQSPTPPYAPSAGFFQYPTQVATPVVFSQPQAYAQLSPFDASFAPGAASNFPSLPHASQPHRQLSEPVRYPCPTLTRGEPERLALPAAGDLNFSMCEVIM